MLDVMNLFVEFPTFDSTLNLFLIRWGAFSSINLTTILMVERIVATRFVQSYENWSRHTWFYILLAGSMALTTAQAVYEVTSGKMFAWYSISITILNILLSATSFVVGLVAVYISSIPLSAEFRFSG